jgi:major membrane immunogen (membrane-anchored lipoprotein)
MSIKNRGEKYVEILNFLRREYVKKFGKEAEGLSDTMLKRQAAEQVDEMSKVVPFPEKNITDWTKERPKTGSKADVKTFPKQKKLTPEPKTSIERLEKELEEMEKLGQPYKDTSVSDFMSDYFDMPKKSKTPATDKMQKMLGDVKLYGDETFDELQIIKDTGKHPRNKAAGGRVKYENGSDPESYDVPTESPLKISGNFSKSKKSEILDYVASLEIPVSEKIKLIGELTGVNSSFKDEYGKYKYQDLMKSVGLNYNEGGEGLSAAFRHNVDTGENDAYFQYKMPFAKGGRIGYAEGMSAEEAVAARLPPNYKFLEDADLKRSPEGIVMEGYQDTTTLDMLRDALKKQERRTPLVEYEDGTIYYPDFDEYYNDDGKQVEGPAFWAKPIPKLFEVPKHSERKSIDLANGGRIGFSKGKRVEGIKSLMEKLNEKLSKKKNKGKVEIADDAPVSEKTKLQREFDEFNKRFKEKTTPDTKI